MNDVSSIDAIIAALYDCVCFSPGGGPDHARLRTLFLPQGRLTPPCDDAEVDIPVLDVDGFIELSTSALATTDLDEKGFHEAEIARRTDMFGAIASVFSTYEARHDADDDEVLARGINAIQLVNHADRWWVVSLLWDDEREEAPIPAQYLAHH